MWTWILSKLGSWMVAIIVLLAIFGLGVKIGYDSSDKKHLQLDNANDKLVSTLIKQNIDIRESYTIELSKYRESTTITFERLNNEINNLTDNANECKLSNQRLRSILTAAKNHSVLPTTTTGNDGADAGKLTDLSNMTCAGLNKTYLACAEQYSICYGRLTTLQNFNHSVSGIR